jgi:hypothetical protein
MRCLNARVGRVECVELYHGKLEVGDRRQDGSIRFDPEAGQSVSGIGEDSKQERRVECKRSQERTSERERRKSSESRQKEGRERTLWIMISRDTVQFLYIQVVYIFW